MRTRAGRRDKWRAVRQIPASAKHLFRWRSDGKYLFWTLALPKDNPWKGKGSLERWVALAFHRHLARQGRTWKAAHMAKVLGVDARTLGVNLARLHAEGYLDGGTTVPLIGGRGKKMNRTTPVAVAGDTGLEHQIKRKAAGLGYTRAQLRKATVDAARTHAAMISKNKYKGGSAMRCLNARLDRELADRATAGREVRRAELEQLVAGLRESVEQAARLKDFQRRDEREARAVDRIRRTLSLLSRGGLPRRDELIERYGVEALERAADALESAGVSWRWNLSVSQIEAVILQPTSAATLTPPAATPAVTASVEPAAVDDDMSVFEDMFSRPAPSAPQAADSPTGCTSADVRREGRIETATHPRLMEDPEFAGQLEAYLADLDVDKLDEACADLAG